MYRDLREYIEVLERHGELVRIQEPVDWDLEAGAITMLSYQLNGPAVLMENIRDYPGQRFLGAPLGSWRRMAIALGLDPDADRRTIQRLCEERLDHPIKPIIVEDAPCQENIFTEDDANLFDLAAPYLHDGDGGRYLSTWAFVATKAYQTDWINWGMYRQMVHNERTMGGLCSPTQDIGLQYYGGWEPAGEPMPFATVIGADIVSSAVSAAPYGIGKSEVEYASGLLLRPVELVKCATVDLLVPANAEIIIEGYVNPKERCYEGPFGEFTGYRSAPRAHRIAYHVTAITFQDNPIIPISNTGVPTDESHLIGNTVWRAGTMKALRDAGIPVVDGSFPTEMALTAFVISVKKPYSAVAQRVGELVFGTSPGIPNIIFVVDEDCNVHDMDEVMHVFGSKWHPSRGTHLFENTVSIPVFAHLSMEERRWSTGTRVVFDCTWPSTWSATAEIPVRSSFWDIFPERIVEKVCSQWQKYGFKEDMKPAIGEYRDKARWPASQALATPVKRQGTNSR